eukprot:1386621-Prymnesium_polylepis.1
MSCFSIGRRRHALRGLRTCHMARLDILRSNAEARNLKSADRQITPHLTERVGDPDEPGADPAEKAAVLRVEGIGVIAA